MSNKEFRPEVPDSIWKSVNTVIEFHNKEQDEDTKYCLMETLEPLIDVLNKWIWPPVMIEPSELETSGTVCLINIDVW
jgi:hypothetical protein